MTPASPSTESRPQQPREYRYWLGLLGGALAWLVHLLASYALAEFGCESILATYSFWGIKVIAWGLLALTVLTAVIAIGSALLAYRNLPADRDGGKHATDFVARLYAARAGLIADAAFTTVILFESIPIFYYLQSCH